MHSNFNRVTKVLSMINNSPYPLIWLDVVLGVGETCRGTLRLVQLLPSEGVLVQVGEQLFKFRLLTPSS